MGGPGRRGRHGDAVALEFHLQGLGQALHSGTHGGRLAGPLSAEGGDHAASTKRARTACLWSSGYRMMGVMP